MDDKKALTSPTSQRFFSPQKCDGAGAGFAHYTLVVAYPILSVCVCVCVCVYNTLPDINILKFSPLDYMFFLF